MAARTVKLRAGGANYYADEPESSFGARPAGRVPSLVRSDSEVTADRGRYTYFASSRRATMPRCTSSGPSAMRSTRPIAASLVSSKSATPSPPWI